uniref:DUF3950 domain-containing protein n=1 Tax=Heterorhabditis bacteriophora TaxID=37862 RepID=A0A1I7WDE1_HETBA
MWRKTNCERNAIPEDSTKDTQQRRVYDFINA